MASARPGRRATRPAWRGRPTARSLSYPPTLSEQTGPVFGHNILGELDNDLIHNFAAPGESAIGPRIIVHGKRAGPVRQGHSWCSGRVLAGQCWRALPAQAKESYIAPLDPNFGGCGRTITGADGSYRFRTIKPGPYPWPNRQNDWRPAHIHFSLFGTGFAQRLITQMYFEGDPLIWRCPIVADHPFERGGGAADCGHWTWTTPSRWMPGPTGLTWSCRGPPLDALFENKLEGN